MFIASGGKIKEVRRIQVPVELFILLLVAFAVFAFTMLWLTRRRRVHQEKPDSSFTSSVPVTIIQDEEPKRTKQTKHETLDMLLTEAVKQNIQRLDITPQITLTNKGEYKILGKTWSGEVSITIKPKEQKTEEKTVEKIEKEKEEPLF